MKPRHREARRLLAPLLFCSLLAVFIFPENSAELEQQLKQAPPGKRSALLNKLAETLVHRDSEESGKASMEYAQKALAYARKYNQPDQEVFALANIGYACIRLRDYNRALAYAEKSLQLAEKRKKREEILYALDVLGGTYTYLGDGLKKALAVFKRKRDIYAEIGDRNGEARSLNRISNIYYILGENEAVLELKEEALELSRDVGDHFGVVRTMEDIASLYRRSGNNQKALQYLLDAVKLAEQEGLAEPAGRLYLHLGKFHKEQRQFKKSAHYLHKAVDLFKKNSLIRWLDNVYLELGDLSREQKEYDQALLYLDQALDTVSLYGEASMYNSPIHVLLKIGQVYFEKKEYRQALSKYEEAAAIFKKIADPDIDLQAECWKYIGEIYLIMDDLKQAYRHLSKSKELAEKSENVSLMRDNYKLLSDYYEKTGNYPGALEYHRLYADLNLKIYNSESAKSIADMQTRYETEKKEKEIELLKRNEEIRELTLSRQKIIRNVSIAGFVLILLIMAYFVKKYHYLLSFWKKKHYIGRYKVVDKIGLGGMGIVYKAHDIQDKTKTFAIKVLREEYFNDDNYKRRFKHEALVIDQLDHPNIIKINERGESDGNLYIAMEFLRGRTLDLKLQEKGRLDLKECFHIMIQVTDALALIHSKNIIHRDLKPANIMLIEKDNDRDFVKLLDFGVAKASFQTRLTKTGMLVGTTGYLSPEQITDSGVTPASDIFSLGIIFYEMICGRRPFIGENENEIIRAILDTAPVEPIKFRPRLPAKMNELIKKMLAKDKELRPTGTETLRTLETVNKQL